MMMIIIKNELEKPIDIEHLTKDATEFDGDFIPVDRMVEQVGEVVDSCALDVFHDHDAFFGPEHLTTISAIEAGRKAGAPKKGRICGIRTSGMTSAVFLTFSKSCLARMAFAASCPYPNRENRT
jgi:hypothetical protein